MRVRIRDRSGAEVKSYEVATAGGESVLDVLDRIRATADASLAYYASCGIGKCGVCGMVVDGKPRLACTCLAEGDELELAPLASGELVRDLLTIRLGKHGDKLMGEEDC